MQEIENQQKIMLNRIKKNIGGFFSAIAPKFWKSYSELSYWKNRKKEEGEFFNEHYSFYYTTHFGLTTDDYNRKRVLDIGCGPRGSLEWANMAKERVGLDPLAEKYLKLGADKHEMNYVSDGSEDIPYRNNHFDIVCAFNSLDHVHDVEKSIEEIKRVTSPGGYFLLLVEINHEPTNCEPHKLAPDLIKQFEPEFLCETVDVYPHIEEGLYQSIQSKKPVADPMNYTDQGWLSAKFKHVN